MVGRGGMGGFHGRGMLILIIVEVMDLYLLLALLHTVLEVQTLIMALSLVLPLMVFMVFISPMATLLDAYNGKSVSRHIHSTIDCFKHLNMAYEGHVPAPRLQVYVVAAPSTSVTTPAVQNWVFDSEANAHITNYPTQVNNYGPYNDTDHVNGVMGSTGLNITHVGNSCIHTPQHKFILPNTLICPNGSTNIISIHQFTNDKNYSPILYPKLLSCPGSPNGEDYFARLE
ncbi:hypothetical protein ACFX1S_035453 [Malus domestica]